MDSYLNQSIPIMLTVRQTAERFGIAQHLARQLALTGKVHAIRAGRNDSIILHEMIHLHESVLMTLPIFFHEAVIYCLYTDLLAKIPNLNSIIEDCTHLYNCMLMAEEGGLHDMLFLLKSFDIDLRFDWPLGTTYGYDMKERIEHYLKEGK